MGCNLTRLLKLFLHYFHYWIPSLPQADNWMEHSVLQHSTSCSPLSLSGDHIKGKHLPQPNLENAFCNRQPGCHISWYSYPYLGHYQPLLTERRPCVCSHWILLSKAWPSRVRERPTSPKKCWARSFHFLNTQRWHLVFLCLLVTSSTDPNIIWS